MGNSIFRHIFYLYKFSNDTSFVDFDFGRNININQINFLTKEQTKQENE